MAKLNFGGVEETVMTREEFPLEKAREVLAGETIAVLGYGVQGPGQSMNVRERPTTRLWPTDGFPVRHCSLLRRPPNARQSLCAC